MPVDRYTAFGVQRGLVTDEERMAENSRARGVQEQIALEELRQRMQLAQMDLGDRAAGRTHQTSLMGSFADRTKEGRLDDEMNFGRQREMFGLTAGHDKDMAGIEGKNRLDTVRAGNEPEMGRLDMQRNLMNEGAGARKAGYEVDELKALATKNALGRIGGGQPQPGQAPAGPMSSDERALTFGLLGVKAPENPEEKNADRIRTMIPILMNSGNPQAKQLASQLMARLPEYQGMNVAQFAPALGAKDPIQALSSPVVQAELQQIARDINGDLTSARMPEHKLKVEMLKNKLVQQGVPREDADIMVREALERLIDSSSFLKQPLTFWMNKPRREELGLSDQ